MNTKYLIGQRVLLNNTEIGTIVKPERKDAPNTDKKMWVHAPSKGYASRYDVCNIKPLPGGQV